jgi:hypothetical protein
MSANASNPAGPGAFQNWPGEVVDKKIQKSSGPDVSASRFEKQFPVRTASEKNLWAIFLPVGPETATKSCHIPAQ